MSALARLLRDDVPVVQREGFVDASGLEPGGGGGAFEGLYGRTYSALLDRPALLRPVSRVVWGAATALRDLESLVARAVAGLDERCVLLDVPCGGGTMFAQVERGGFAGTLVGADLSAAMLRQAVGRGARTSLRVELLRCDALDLPLRDGVVDRVLSVNGLHCMPDPAAFLRSLHRVLRPGGSAWLVTMVSDGNPQRRLVNELGRRGGVLPQLPPTQEQLDRMAEDAGFAVERLGGTGVVGIALTR